MLLSNALLFQENLGSRLGSAGLFLAIDAFDATRSTKTYMKHARTHAVTHIPSLRPKLEAWRTSWDLSCDRCSQQFKTKRKLSAHRKYWAMLRRSAQNVEWTSRSPSGCAATLNRIHAALLRRWRERATPAAAAAQTNQVSHVAR